MSLNLAFCQHHAGDDIEVVGFFQLVLYDHDMRTLYHELSSLLHQRFGDAEPCFGSNQRLVFLHDDLDFWISQDGVPFTLYNLQLILRELGISNCFCRIITNLPDYQVYADRVAQLLTNDVPIKVIDANLIQGCYLEDANELRPGHELSDEIYHINPEPDRLIWPFWLASRVNRPHRTLLMSQLHYHGLHQRGLVSYHNVDSSYLHTESREPTSSQPLSLPLLTVNNWPRHNCDLNLKNPDMIARYLAFKNVQNLHHPHSLNQPSWYQATRWRNPDIQQALVSVCMETTVSLPRPFVSRITMRPILHWRPFVVLGCPGTLGFLQRLGFQTFGEFWDESYDIMLDIEDRVRSIAEILQQISQMSQIQLREMYQSMRYIVEHNREHYISTFGQQLITSLRQGLT